MDWHAALGIASGIIQISSVVPYLRDMLRGTTRPNAVSMGLWTLMAGIAAYAQYRAGSSWSIILVMGVAFNAALITGLALCGYGYTKYELLDWICLVLGITAIGGWVLTDNPLVALVLVVVASVLASIPTIVKTYREPQSESARAWLIVLVASSLSILSTTRWDIQNLLYPLIDWIENIIFVSLAIHGQKLKLSGLLRAQGKTRP